MDVDDVDTTLPQPLAAVFAHLAAPAHLGDWLADAPAVEGEAEASTRRRLNLSQGETRKIGMREPVDSTVA